MTSVMTAGLVANLQTYKVAWQWNNREAIAGIMSTQGHGESSVLQPLPQVKRGPVLIGISGRLQLPT